MREMHDTCEVEEINRIKIMQGRAGGHLESLKQMHDMQSGRNNSAAGQAEIKHPFVPAAHSDKEPLGPFTSCVCGLCSQEVS